MKTLFPNMPLPVTGPDPIPDASRSETAERERQGAAYRGRGGDGGLVVAPAGGRRGRGVGGGDGGGVPVRGGGAHGLRGEGLRGGGAHGRWVVVLEGGRWLGLGLPSVGHRGGVAAAPRQAPGGRRSPPGRCARFYASGVGGMRRVARYGFDSTGVRGGVGMDSRPCLVVASTSSTKILTNN